MQRLDELYDRYRRERNLDPRQAFQMRNIATDSLFKELVDYPPILPLIVDLMGYNIQLRTSHLDVRPPQDPADGEHELGAPDSFFPLARRWPQLRLARGRWSAAVYGDESRLLLNRPDPTFERCHLRCARQPSPIAVD